MSEIYKKYMDPLTVGKIDNLSLRAKLVVEGLLLVYIKVLIMDLVSNFLSIDLMVLVMKLNLLIGNFGPKQIVFILNNLKKKQI